MPSFLLPFGQSPALRYLQVETDPATGELLATTDPLDGLPAGARQLAQQAITDADFELAQLLLPVAVPMAAHGLLALPGWEKLYHTATTWPEDLGGQREHPNQLMCRAYAKDIVHVLSQLGLHKDQAPLARQFNHPLFLPFDLASADRLMPSWSPYTLSMFHSRYGTLLRPEAVAAQVTDLLDKKEYLKADAILAYHYGPVFDGLIARLFAASADPATDAPTILREINDRPGGTLLSQAWPILAAPKLGWKGLANIARYCLRNGKTNEEIAEALELARKGDRKITRSMITLALLVVQPTRQRGHLNRMLRSFIKKDKETGRPVVRYDYQSFQRQVPTPYILNRFLEALKSDDAKYRRDFCWMVLDFFHHYVYFDTGTTPPTVIDAHPLPPDMDGVRILIPALKELSESTPTGNKCPYKDGLELLTRVGFATSAREEVVDYLLQRTREPIQPKDPFVIPGYLIRFYHFSRQKAAIETAIRQAVQRNPAEAAGALKNLPYLYQDTFVEEIALLLEKGADARSWENFLYAFKGRRAAQRGNGLHAFRDSATCVLCWF